MVRHPRRRLPRRRLDELVKEEPVKTRGIVYPKSFRPPTSQNKTTRATRHAIGDCDVTQRFTLVHFLKLKALKAPENFNFFSVRIKIAFRVEYFALICGILKSKYLWDPNLFKNLLTLRLTVRILRRAIIAVSRFLYGPLPVLNNVFPIIIQIRFSIS